MSGATLTAGSARAAASSQPSVAEVYDRHVDFVSRMARGLGVPPSAVGDVVQDVFLVVHRKLPSFEGRSKLKTWIAKIVLNVVRSHRRAHHKRKRDEPIEEELVIDAAGKTPDRVAQERQAVRMLAQILDAMSDEQRAVFVLAEIEGLEMADVARTLSINPNTGYSRLRLARQIYTREVARVRKRLEREKR